ncbi:hypothetical protein D0Y60_13305 [Shinella sp. WSJ-2]|uniref:oligosaccharide flippase family protein n=1 Tax=Shinella sp. WSJ-2 TaxID=2303749 RepID=UPI000E3B955A|nr:oligosaccharide flippase family protein [Shinella sp. WSJ-2]RFZ86969.1 hypothetical protein D0Y60_13305 [Shinella sp. WSJ-2]
MVRRAYVMASLEQYFALLINFTVLVIMARILTPGEIGEAVTGLAVAVVAFSAREFVTPEFLIQRSTVDAEALRTALTLQVAVSAVIAGGLVAVSGLVARFYAAPDLSFFLLLAAAAGLAESQAQPVIALLRREMGFGALACIRTAVSLTTALVTIALAILGFGPVSFAWGMLAGSLTLAMLAVACSPFPAAAIFRPGLARWREVLAFGLFKGAALVVERIHETVPQLILGRIASMTSVALYNRSNALCGIPDRIIMSAFHSMAFPALASRVREGHDIEKTYLGVLAYLSVLYWPGAALISLLAPSIVGIVLGPQWAEAVPVVRVLALAAVFWLPVIVTGPLLLALGRNRDAFLASLVSRCFAAGILCAASLYGVMAMALSQFVSLPLQMLVALVFVHRHVRFSLLGLLTALMPSAVVTGFSLAGPVVLLALPGHPDAGLPGFCAAILLAGIGWLIGLLATRHPFLAELHILLAAGRDHARRLRRFLVASGA